jgi:Fe-S-cluster containining protein
MNPAIREGLLAIYNALDADVRAEGPVCDLSGRCCRFRKYGHTLFITRSEAELLLECGLPDGAVIDEGSCPFQQGKLCTARDRRPLGCRVYYCDPSYAGRGEALSERYIAHLKDLHRTSDAEWEYRPLHHFLRESVATTANREVSCDKPEGPVFRDVDGL